MFVCLFDEVVSYLFYRKPSTEVNWWFHLNHISSQVTKRRAGKRLQDRCFPVKFAEFLRTPFSMNTSDGCFWRWTRRNQTAAHDIPIEQMLYLNYSLWIVLVACRNGHVVTFFNGTPKVKWDKTKWKISFLHSFKKGNFSL